jgi:hypothetical protein
MRLTLAFSLVMAFAASSFAKEAKAYETGKLLQMESVQCGTLEKDGSSLTGEMLGTDAGAKKTHEVLCQEYVLESERVIYRIRPRKEKHPALLPVGDRAQFRLKGDKMLLRVEDVDSKEHEYVVVSMKPRTENSTADATPVRINHLQ